MSSKKHRKKIKQKHLLIQYTHLYNSLIDVCLNDLPTDIKNDIKVDLYKDKILISVNSGGGSI